MATTCYWWEGSSPSELPLSIFSLHVRQPRGDVPSGQDSGEHPLLIHNMCSDEELSVAPPPLSLSLRQQSQRRRLDRPVSQQLSANPPAYSLVDSTDLSETETETSLSEVDNDSEPITPPPPYSP